jgi:GTP-binding protein HflX
VSSSASESFGELKELAASAGVEVVAESFQTRPVVDAATLIGHGKVLELKELAEACQAAVVVFDNDLTPTQQRNLEAGIGVKVIDRTQIILDIFASRARTAEGRLQVELAQLKYLLPRISGQGISMSRLGGGIGTRGPGETKLETDRRRIDVRIKKIELDLERVRRGRALHRGKREALPIPTISLAGYTNAGKSTLFNRLTSSGVLADAKMFATLDPTVRSITLPSRRRVLLSDTVGFIRNLPTTLIEAFKATLEEVAEAALVVHVVDASSDQAAAHVAEVFRILGEIGAADTPQVLVLNKCDRLQQTDGSEHIVLQGEILDGEPMDASLGLDAAVLGARLLEPTGRRLNVPSVLVSGLTGAGLEDLLAMIDQAIAFDDVELVRFRIPMKDGGVIAMLHEFGKVRAEDYTGNLCQIDVEAPLSLRTRLRRYVVHSSTVPVEKSVNK